MALGLLTSTLYSSEEWVPQNISCKSGRVSYGEESGQHNASNSQMTSLCTTFRFSPYNTYWNILKFEYSKIITCKRFLALPFAISLPLLFRWQILLNK